LKTLSNDHTQKQLLFFKPEKPLKHVLCHADVCGAAACFSCAKDLGMAKRVRFKNKNVTLLI
jgi:hypothetical protein